MKFYDIEIFTNSEKEIEIRQNNIYEDKPDCIFLTKDMVVSVIQELETLLKKISNEE